MTVQEFRSLGFTEREAIIEQLSKYVMVIGSSLYKGQYLQLIVKPEPEINTNTVKAFLKRHFNIHFRKEYDYNADPAERMFTEQENIIELCKLTLEVNLDLDYYNKYAPFASKISDRVYMYGNADYQRLVV